MNHTFFCGSHELRKTIFCDTLIVDSRSHLLSLTYTYVYIYYGAGLVVNNVVVIALHFYSNTKKQ